MAHPHKDAIDAAATPAERLSLKLAAFGALPKGKGKGDKKNRKFKAVLAAYLWIVMPAACGK